ncbi:MAG: 1-acyl-sn-glycerol-3-phosphate acyltransferase [Pirellulaceae bacterium]|nr:1-acyl-sn-glycerol-3-phosphate acyltransferase [Planctomycetales bacterium]MCA9209929.1 1-acyl-sn-glycerol-3-phosphate acyltransferase [Planctomycetales bacterium]MCA9225452.1 1-acyl-sn-glycerol-3-phosphate acyltransferase [Planctomycetales bacterium]
MQNIIVDRPYGFVPPHRGTWWPAFIRYFDFQGVWLRKAEGVVDYECRHVERLRESLRAERGILLAPNHCRNGDPIVMGWLSKEAGCHVYAMASWHLYNQGRFKAWAIQKMGGFSVNREGIDRQAINTAVQILETAERPLVVFPEGAVTRTNDRLHSLLEGVAFIARTGAKKRAARVDGGKVVVHPVALKYRFQGDIRKAVDDVLTDIEHRFTWRPQRERPLLERINRLGRALLCLKELQYFGETQTGRMEDRMLRLIDRLLSPLEEEWLGRSQTGGVVPRVKALRMRILPEIVAGTISEQERERRWRQLEDIYLAQQVSCYPPDYLTLPSVDRVLETVERLEEDLTDRCRVHGRLKVIIDVGEAIEVSPLRNKSADEDPLMVQLGNTLQRMLDELSLESPLIDRDA